MGLKLRVISRGLDVTPVVIVSIILSLTFLGCMSDLNLPTISTTHDKFVNDRANYLAVQAVLA
jgi:hypothetical protein